MSGGPLQIFSEIRCKTGRWAVTESSYFPDEPAWCCLGPHFIRGILKQLIRLPFRPKQLIRLPVRPHLETIDSSTFPPPLCDANGV